MAVGIYSFGVFLDMEQAFDAVSFKATKETLLTAGIPPTISEWIYHMMNNKFITLSYCDASVTRKASKGSLHGGGGVLSCVYSILCVQRVARRGAYYRVCTPSCVYKG
jgi:hypothetical protein